jgi:hypothetical protein
MNPSVNKRINQQIIRHYYQNIAIQSRTNKPQTRMKTLFINRVVTNSINRKKIINQTVQNAS